MTALRRVLIVTQFYWPEVGAPQTRYAAITRVLTRMGVQVDVVTGVPNYPTGRIHDGYSAWRATTETHEGVRIHRLPLFAYGGTNKWLRLVNHGSLATTAFAGALIDLPTDLVIVESPPLPLVLPAATIARRYSAPLVMYVPDLWPDVPLAMGALRPGFAADRLRDLESLCYRLSWRITVTSDGQWKTIAAHPDGGAKKVLMLPNGFDAEVFRPYRPDECAAQRARVGPLADRALFVHAGTLGHVSALDTILGAAAALRADRSIGFVLVGDGPERARLERDARERSLDNVVFVGAVPPESVGRYFSLARASIASQRDLHVYERVRPAKVLPSLGSGCGVVYAGRGEMAEMLVRERCGVVIPPEDAAAMARAVSELAGDPDRGRALGDRGRTFAVRDYDFGALVQHWWAELTEAYAARAA